MTQLDKGIQTATGIDYTYLYSLDDIEVRKIAENPWHNLFYQANEEMWRREGNTLENRGAHEMILRIARDALI